jgi:IS4 transposase
LGLRSAQSVVLASKKSRAAYPEALRRVSYVDLDTKKRFVYLTNIFTVSAITVADIYKQRWQVELFFR